jgi:GNAT superfamily N-acetyltransferase
VTIEVRPVTADRWDDVVAVMGTRGEPSRCWCQFFKLRGQEWRSATREGNREALRAQVCDEALPPGVLAYDRGDPVGWCAVAPMSAYARVLAARHVDTSVDGVWSVTCFVVRVGHRRKGISGALLAGAVELARSKGAAVVDGYPVDPSARASVSSAELYHGTLSMFEQAGFTAVARPSPGRVVMRLVL